MTAKDPWRQLTREQRDQLREVPRVDLAIRLYSELFRTAHPLEQEAAKIMDRLMVDVAEELELPFQPEAEA